MLFLLFLMSILFLDHSSINIVKNVFLNDS